MDQQRGQQEQLYSFIFLKRVLKLGMRRKRYPELCVPMHLSSKALGARKVSTGQMPVRGYKLGGWGWGDGGWDSLTCH